MSAWRWCQLFAVVACCCWIAGCGPARAKTGTPVSGVVIEGGQPVVYEGEGSGDDDFGYIVEFIPLDESGQPVPGQVFSENVEEAGQFQLYGQNRADFPAGKYKVAVYCYAPAPGGGGDDDDEGSDEKVDLLGGKYDRQNTPFTFDVEPGDNVEITLEAGAAASGGTSE